MAHIKRRFISKGDTGMLHHFEVLAVQRVALMWLAAGPHQRPRLCVARKSHVPCMYVPRCLMANSGLKSERLRCPKCSALPLMWRTARPLRRPWHISCMACDLSSFMPVHAQMPDDQSELQPEALHLLEVLTVQRVALDMAYCQAAPAPQALHVEGDLIRVVHVQQDDLAAPREPVPPVAGCWQLLQEQLSSMIADEEPRNPQAKERRDTLLKLRKTLP